jgi:cytochrome c peroxidase
VRPLSCEKTTLEKFFAAVVFVGLSLISTHSNFAAGQDPRQNSSDDSAYEALPAKVADPSDNPRSPAKVELGKTLFFDPRLSRTGTVSCNTCHNLMGPGIDGTPVSTGVEGKLGTRNAPTVWNSALHTVQFWDGRAASLEEQAKGPLTKDVEMGQPNEAAVVERVESIPGYEPLFKKAFPKETKPVTIDTLVKAIAAFERTLLTPNSPFDRYMRGHKQALGPQALKGMALADEIGCSACHMGPDLSAPADLPMGVGFYQIFPKHSDNEYVRKYNLAQDLGRFEQTKLEKDKHKWRVPTWRNVALTAPYFHNGSVKTLDEAVRVMAKTQLDRDLNDDEVASLVAFLKSFTGERPHIAMPRLPDTVGRSFQ